MTRKISELAEGEDFLFNGGIYTRGKKIPANPYVGYVTYEGIRRAGSVLLFKGDTEVQCSNAVDRYKDIYGGN